MLGRYLPYFAHLPYLPHFDGGFSGGSMSTGIRRHKHSAGRHSRISIQIFG
jgi:hypothetical protein